MSDLARRFHDTYERLAPHYGYTTRTDTREFDPDSSNGRLMAAVCSEVFGALEAEVERLRESIAQFVYANDTEVSDDRPITPEEWEADWETAMSGLRAALAGEGDEA